MHVIGKISHHLNLVGAWSDACCINKVPKDCNFRAAKIAIGGIQQLTSSLEHIKNHLQMQKVA